MILETCKLVKSNQWKKAELEKVLKNLKTNKTRDPFGLINELFKPGCAGEGLKQVLLSLPEVMKLANITLEEKRVKK